MMNKIFDWVKQNKLVVLLLVIIGFLILRQFPRRYSRRNSFQTLDSDINLRQEKAMPASPGRGGLPVAGGGSAPRLKVKDRMVVEHSNVSAVVDDVKTKVDQVLNYVQSKNGYMVSSSINQPEENPFATLVVRLPREELRPAIEKLRGLALKITSENIIGRDVTDQYIDLEERLTTLYKTKAKFEDILDKATKVDDILRVQRELISLQGQIDNLKGQQKYLEKTAENAKLTVYLASDELALPYMPAKNEFRPKVVFKLAVRSLVNNLRSIARLAIWLGVYSIIFAPILIIIYFVKRRK